MHAIRVLREDHERMKGLLAALTEADGRARAGLFRRLAKELAVHTVAEDNVFLPQVEEAIEDSRRTTAEFFEDDAGVLEEAAELVASSYENHRRTRDLLQNAGEDGSEEVVSELRRVLARGIEDEERLFPKAERVLEEEDFERIGDLIEHCKGQVRGLAQAKLASSSSFTPSPTREAELLLEESRRE